MLWFTGIVRKWIFNFFTTPALKHNHYQFEQHPTAELAAIVWGCFFRFAIRREMANLPSRPSSKVEVQSPINIICLVRWSNKHEKVARFYFSFSKTCAWCCFSRSRFDFLDAIASFNNLALHTRHSSDGRGEFRAHVNPYCKHLSLYCPLATFHTFWRHLPQVFF